MEASTEEAATRIRFGDRFQFFQIVIIQREDLPTWKIKHPGLSLQMGGKNQGERRVGRQRNKKQALWSRQYFNGEGRD